MPCDWKSVGFVAIKPICGFVMLISAVFTVYTVGPSLETRMWPVVAKLQILSVKSRTDGRTEIRAAFRKLRGCEYLGIAWYVGDRPNDFRARFSGAAARPDRYGQPKPTARLPEGRAMDHRRPARGHEDQELRPALSPLLSILEHNHGILPMTPLPSHFVRLKTGWSRRDDICCPTVGMLDFP